MKLFEEPKIEVIAFPVGIIMMNESDGYIPDEDEGEFDGFGG